MNTTKLHYIIYYKKQLYKIPIFLKTTITKIKKKSINLSIQKQKKKNILLNKIHLTQIHKYKLKYPFTHLLISTILL